MGLGPIPDIAGYRLMIQTGRLSIPVAFHLIRECQRPEIDHWVPTEDGEIPDGRSVINP